MGLCISCNSRIEDNICYYEDIVLYIKERDRLGKVFRSDKVHFKVSAPVYTQCDELDLQKMKINVSSCVINGMDPRLVLNKECQDNLMYLQKDEVFLTAVFDGHGIEGLRVVDYTKDYIKKYFTQNSNAFKTAPLETITYMITECDKKLRNPSSGIDCSISGTTAVVLVISDTLHIGSVGDSKAILAILGAADPNYIPSKRYIEPSRQLFPMKLTADQRPNIRQELERIKKAGGKVQQLTNEQGQKIGPYRVWKKKGTLPGLAMSRSIGDSIGKEIGVISNPICNSFLIDKTTDLFIVLATDGIWDVMDSTEVINFVDKFRKICKKVVEPINYPIKADNTVIAHFLAEEARFRWLEVCQEEDVMIDDIGVIVLEFNFLEPFGTIAPGSRAEIALNSAVSLPDAGRLVGSKGDLVRGSFIPAREIARRRIDPKRGSYVNENQKVEDIDPDCLDIPYIK